MNVTRMIKDFPNTIEVKVISIADYDAPKSDRFIKVISRSNGHYDLPLTKTLKHFVVGGIYTIYKIRYFSNGSERYVDLDHNNYNKDKAAMVV